jgi:3-oxoadipate enol-lactonase
VTFAEVDGARLHIRQRGTGPVALFVHGFPLDSTLWLEQIAALSDLRRCIAPDLRGFGRSSPVTGAPLLMEDHAADLAAVLDLVSAEQADIIGLSMGGYVALAFAELYPDRVRSLALVDTKAGPDDEPGRRARDEAAARVVRDGRGSLADTMEAALLGPDPSLSTRARLRTMIEGCRYETIVAALAGMRDRPDRGALLPGCNVPSAVIVGEHDTVTPPGEAAAMAAALPDASLHTIAAAGHLSPIEQPAAVAAVLRTLLERA